jgi:hypothetical protein
MSNRPELTTPEDAALEIPWPVRASAVLLLGQLFLFWGLAGLNGWVTAVSTWDDLADQFLAGEPVFFFILGLLLLSLLTGWSLWRFYTLHRRGWLYAMLTQTFCLLLGLIAYFLSRSLSAQAMLLSGIVMTIYLHNPETKAAFHIKNGPEEAE